MRNQSRTSPRRAGTAGPASSGPRAGRGFTVVELLVCIGVVALLCGILLPALRTTRESSMRLKCQANLHTIGCALAAYANIHDERLPPSVFAMPGQRDPASMNTAWLGSVQGVAATKRWDGIGLLVAGNYLHDGCQCLYCPSHHGDHPYDRYTESYNQPANDPIVTNYQYSGHIDRAGSRISMNDGSDRMLVTDALRSRADFNHRCGANRLFADLHTDWWYDYMDSLAKQLPGTSSDGVLPSAALYEDFWATVEQTVEQ
jgi:type II secretory pathway pseudopilin PulG